MNVWKLIIFAFVFAAIVAGEVQVTVSMLESDWLISIRLFVFVATLILSIIAALVAIAIVEMPKKESS